MQQIEQMQRVEKTRQRLVGLSLSLVALVVIDASLPNAQAQSRRPTRVAAKTSTTRSGKIPADHPLLPVLKVARESQAAVAKVEDYSALFIKREMIKNRLQTHTMQLKVREEPFSVYVKYYKPHAGREVIYVDGANQGKLLAHEDGLKSIVGTVAVLPTSADAMSDNRYPITDIGIANMLDITIAQWEDELQFGEVDAKFYPNAKLGNIDCKMIETIHPRPAPQFKFHITRMYIEHATNLPVRVEQFGFPKKAGDEPQLEEEYTYTDLKTNIGLGSADFDTENPDYSF